MDQKWLKIGLLAVGVIMVFSVGGLMLSNRTGNHDVPSPTPEQPTDVAAREMAGVESGLSMYPNFGKFFDFIDMEDTAWILVSGGIIKYDKASGGAEMYSIKDGFNGTISRNMVLRNGSIWVATSRNILQFDIATEKFRTYESVFSNPKDSWGATFGRQVFDTIDGLSADSNHQLYSDPYTGQLWTVSFNGVSRFDDEKNNWVSYGLSVDNERISNTSRIAFSKDYVAVSVPGGGDSSGGVFVSDRSGEYKWKNTSKDSSYELDENLNSLVSGADTLWAIGRPKTYSSCADDKKSKAVVILGYAGVSTWEKDAVLNGEIAYGEDVYQAEYSDGKLSVYVRRACDSSGRRRYFEYDLGKHEIVSRRAVDNAVTMMTWGSGREDQMKEKEKEFVPVLEKIFGQAAEKSLVSMSNGRILLDITDSSGKRKYKEFYPDMSPYTASDEFWGRLSEIERPFLDGNGVSKDSRLIPVSCVGYPQGSVLLRTNSNDWGMFGPIHDLIALFDGKKLKVMRNINYRDAADQKESFLLEEPFFCNAESYLVFSPDHGVADYDLAARKIVFPDEENFRGTKRGYYGRTIVRGKVYFPTADGTIGSFDPSDRKYHYVPVPDALRSADSLKVFEDDGRYLYLAATGGTDNGTMHVYDREAGSWQDVFVSHEHRGTINSIISFRDMVWVLDTEGVYSGIWNVLKKGEWISRRVGYARGEFTGYPRDGGIKAISDDEMIVFSGDTGVWIFRE